MVALAFVLDGVSRTEAAQAAGMDFQTLRPGSSPQRTRFDQGVRQKWQHRAQPNPFLPPEPEAEIAAWVRRGPDLAEHGVVRWRRAGLARAIQARFGVGLAERRMRDGLRRLGLRRPIARPRHPGHDAGA